MVLMMVMMMLVAGIYWAFTIHQELYWALYINGLIRSLQQSYKTGTLTVANAHIRKLRLWRLENVPPLNNKGPDPYNL